MSHNTIEIWTGRKENKHAFYFLRCAAIAAGLTLGAGVGGGIGWIIFTACYEVSLWVMCTLALGA